MVSQRVNVTKILNNKKLTEFCRDILKMKRTYYREVVFDIRNNAIGAITRNGELKFFNELQAKIIEEWLSQGATEKATQNIKDKYGDVL